MTKGKRKYKISKAKHRDCITNSIALEKEKAALFEDGYGNQ